jgi:hypothetical protein
MIMQRLVKDQRDSAAGTVTRIAVVTDPGPECSVLVAASIGVREELARRLHYGSSREPVQFRPESI